MKVLETQSAHLSNYEVLSHVESMRERYKATAQRRGSGPVLKSGNLETIIKEVTDYLHRRPSPLASGAGYTDDMIRDLFTRLEPFDLTKAELLMILNLRPLDLTALDTIVEEIDERFAEDQQQEIITIVGQVLGSEGATEEHEDLQHVEAAQDTGPEALKEGDEQRNGP